jgi:hypothetical protein
MSNYYEDDNPNLPYGVKFYRTYRIYAQYLAFAVMGLIVWSMLYMIQLYYRDFLVTYLKSKEDRGFYYKLVDYYSSYKRVIAFTIIFSLLCITIFFIEYCSYIYFAGFIEFSILYIIYLIKNYYIDDNDFDYFDDFIYLYYRLTLKKDKKKEKID